MIGREVERETAVAAAVLMAAFKAGPCVAEQHGPRSEHGRTERRAVLEAALRHRSNANSIVPLLKRPIARPGGADDIADAPTGARCQQT